jgi:hypothetical protein
MGGSDNPAEIDTTGGAAADTSNGTPIPTAVADLEPDEVLCDRHRKECFVVREVEHRGTHLEQDDADFFVPYSLLAPWVDSRLFSVDESESADLPEWLPAE